MLIRPSGERHISQGLKFHFKADLGPTGVTHWLRSRILLSSAGSRVPMLFPFSAREGCVFRSSCRILSVPLIWSTWRRLRAHRIPRGLSSISLRARPRICLIKGHTNIRNMHTRNVNFETSSWFIILALQSYRRSICALVKFQPQFRLSLNISF